VICAGLSLFTPAVGIILGVASADPVRDCCNAQHNIPCYRTPTGRCAHSNLRRWLGTGAPATASNPAEASVSSPKAEPADSAYLDNKQAYRIAVAV
jgi:hypothetical protein